MKDYEQLKENVTSLMYDVCDKRDISLDEYENLYETGILDSIRMMELIIQMESEFNIEFLGDELYFENFETLGKICNILTKKLTNKGGVVSDDR